MKGPWLLALLLPGLALAEPLRLWHAYRAEEEKALQMAVKRFTELHPTQVELSSLPYDAYASKLTAAIPHGVGPDVFIFAHERLRAFVASGLVSKVLSPLDESLYLPGAIEALKVSGQAYGYPLSQKTLALYVNRRLVKKAPETTDELLATLASLSHAPSQRFGLAYEAGDFYFHAPFLFGFGGRLFDEDGRAFFRDEGMAKSLSFVRSLQDQGFIPQEASGALVKSLFNEERAAMVISGPWFAGEIAASLSYDISPLPLVVETQRPLTPFLGVEAALVSARASQPALAHALARFLSGPEAGIVLAKVGRQIPSHRQVFESAELGDDAFLSSFQKAAEKALPMPNTLEMSRVWEPMKLALRGVLQGAVEPKDAGALADRRYRALHREKPPPSPKWPYVGLFACALALLVSRAMRRRRGAGGVAGETGRALAFVLPAAVGLLVLVMVPLSVGVSLSLFHHEAGEYTFVGLANFVDLLTSRGYRVTEPLSFYFTLAVTVLWTAVNVCLHVGIGLFLALLLKSPWLRLRGFFRVLLILPWAVPNYLTALIWKGMFHRQFGAINGMLEALGVEPISWFTRFSTAFAANVVTNTWLGFPFMMVVSLGALQSIPQELYEAAEVDGASAWTQFRKITLPLLQPALLPAVILGSVWTFNMFNIIYLVSGGEPGGATDILVSESFRWAFQRNEQYGFAAAYSVLIFGVLWLWSKATRRLTEAMEAAS